MVETDYSKPLKNKKYELFCQAYYLNANGTQAAKDAGYSKKTAYSKANQLLNIVDIEARIAYLQAQIAKRAEKSADDVIRELEKIGFSNLHDYIEGDNIVKDLSTLPRDKVAAVESIQITEDKRRGNKVKIKLYDKKSALVDLGRRHGIFGKDNEQSRYILNTPGLKCKT